MYSIHSCAHSGLYFKKKIMSSQCRFGWRDWIWDRCVSHTAVSVICKLQVSFWDSIWDRCVSHICTLRFADQFLGQNLRHACDFKICMLICNTKFSMGFGEQFEESQYARIHTVFLVITRKSQKLKFLPLFIP